MGYLKPEKMGPFDPVSWVEEEHDYTHQFSLQKRFYDYGYFRLKEIFEIDEYLNMEAYLLDKAMKYIRLGSEDRLRHEQAKKSEADRFKAEDVEREVLKTLNER